ncbi:MAG: SDR family oxidoreductase [Betaproteobacteria bacterium]|nr:SDR family oxidoreductase [Betaproteobacteria bacterium]
MSAAGTRWAGRVALVTGSSSGTGAEIAREFARLGAHVAVHCRSDMAAAKRVVDGIRQEGHAATAFCADLGDAAQTRKLAAEVAERLGPISILVNNAGPFADAPFLTLRERDWDVVLAVNLKAPFLLVQEIAPAMIRQGWGRIINLGATSSLVRSHSIYGLAKAAVIHLTESLALELAPAVTVNAIVPSQIASPRTDTMPVYKDAAIAGTPLGRLVTEQEIAKMAAWMCEAEFDFMTGRAIILDGGRTLPRFPRLGLGPEG